MITPEQENERLKACLRYLRVLFKYGEGVGALVAPEVVTVIETAMKEDVINIATKEGEMRNWEQVAELLPPVGWLAIGVYSGPDGQGTIYIDSTGREIKLPLGQKASFT